MKMKHEYRQQNWKIFNIAKERGKVIVMQTILRKRVLRDLKENLFRYLALGILILVSMYLIVDV